MFKKYISALLVAGSCIASPQLHANTEQALLDAQQWRFATDPYGSQAILKESLIVEQGAWIHFKRIPRVDAKRNSWVELIYDLPSKSLGDNTMIRLHYKSDQPLLLKLSQKDYGGAGDKSYAHYQITLPAGIDWNSQTVSLADFKRPDWTPEQSIDVGIIHDNISAIYIVPNLTDAKGGEATVEVKAIELLP